VKKYLRALVLIVIAALALHGALDLLTRYMQIFY
jgi:hypothetical protein